MAEKEKVGVIEHYFGNLSVAVVNLTGTLRKGDKISIEGPSTNLQQTADSMQIDKKSVAEAKKGQSIGMKVAGKVKEKDVVYKVK